MKTVGLNAWFAHLDASMVGVVLSLSCNLKFFPLYSGHDLRAAFDLREMSSGPHTYMSC